MQHQIQVSGSVYAPATPPAAIFPTSSRLLIAHSSPTPRPLIAHSNTQASMAAARRAIL
jgi:hypothetical protein